jgi:pre-mRNA-processing factor 6
MNVDLRIFKLDRPPPGYIPGLGRGAVGFMTRSDIGSASAAPE